MKSDTGNPHADPMNHLRSALRRSSPLLPDPGEIPGRVMRATDHLRKQEKTVRSIHFQGNRFLMHAQRLLTAASVCLLVWYGVEEYIVLSKVRSLEKSMASAGMNPAATIAKRMAKHGEPEPGLRQYFKGRADLLASSKNHVQDNPESTFNHFNQ